MIEKRKTYSVKLGNKDVMHRVILESSECLPDGERSKYIKFGMLQQIVLDPNLTYCDVLDFESLQMKHMNGKWIVEVKAIKKHKEET